MMEKNDKCELTNCGDRNDIIDMGFIMNHSCVRWRLETHVQQVGLIFNKLRRFQRAK